ncbi:MAG: hypothetical protein WCI73_03755 [Phycisphaerae bacterium]
MKVTVQEQAGCFGIDLEAENPVESALLVHFGADATHEIRHLSATAQTDGKFYFAVVFGKNKRASQMLPRRNER